MLSKRIATVIPPMSLEEAIETTKIHSIAGLLTPEQSFVPTRPFRSPHHTISDIGLLGGGAIPNPGEVSLAHNGVLFLDELPEFHRSTLEVMRQPLEDGTVCIARAAMSLTFPARFMLAAAMNPCPCGYFNDRTRECHCTQPMIQRYVSKISGPLLDRIDIHVEVPTVPYRELTSKKIGTTSATMRQQVERARALQQTRFKDHASNASMDSRQLKQHCELTDSCLLLMKQAMDELGLSARAYDKVRRVARTIADLEGSDVIKEHHLAEAIQYRLLDRKF
jgi:magnesium chelatase family protein